MAALRAGARLIGLGLLALFLASLLAGAGVLLVSGSQAPPSALDEADALLAAGRYHEAFAAYTDLHTEQPTPPLALRLGLMRLLRGEHLAAQRILWQAYVEAPPDAAERPLAALTLGVVALRQNNPAEARRVWQWARSCPPRQPTCSYPAMQALLAAELALHAGEHTAALRAYREALLLSLPADWRALGEYRLALLLAAEQPNAALRLLEHEPPQQGVSPPLLHLLLPVDNVPVLRAQLRTVLRAPLINRRQLLGQFYVDQTHYALALNQFDAVQPASPHALAARVYGAYARWQLSGAHRDRAAFDALLRAYPNDSRVQALAAATAALRTTQPTAVFSSTLQQLAPNRPETHLVWGLWHTTQSDYVAATAAFQQARLLAQPRWRGHYAEAVARFHLRTTFEMCTTGLRAAQDAVQADAQRAEAWTLLAGMRYQCSDFAAAVSAAQRALALAERADGHYYLGAALARLNDPLAARTHLLRAADLAPASVWRERAEVALHTLVPAAAR